MGHEWAELGTPLKHCSGTSNPKFDLLLFHLAQGLARPEKTPKIPLKNPKIPLKNPKIPLKTPKIPLKNPKIPLKPLKSAH